MTTQDVIELKGLRLWIDSQAEGFEDNTVIHRRLHGWMRILDRVIEFHDKRPFVPNPELPAMKELTPEEAVALLPKAEHVHTMRSVKGANIPENIAVGWLQRWITGEFRDEIGQPKVVKG